MDINFTEEQEMLRKSAHDFLVAECPKTKVRELEEDEKGYSPELWGKMAGLGWMGLAIPEEYEGMGMSFQDLTVLLEEMGRNVLPGPFNCTVVQGVYFILEAGNEAQKKEYLPMIANGKVIFTTALLEPGGIYYGPDGITLKAVTQGDKFVLNGTKVFVELANVADYIICAARTKDASNAEDGVSLFMVDAKAPGLKYEVMPTIAFDKQCEVRFENVDVPKENLLGELNKGWLVVQKVMQKGVIAKCAESVGGMQAAVDMTVAYCKERVQYDRPIGAFQALQHIMADMWILTQTSKYLVYQVAWMESEGLPCEMEAAMAKAYVNENYKVVTERTVSLHGGIGTSREHDAGLYYRRAKAADTAFGDTDFNREIVAEKIGLIS
ncbi:MAG: acyl-CoA/acyl-ACP dehydrogenase [Dehalococcoidia bacterium]|nr:MAG: acyl-CoA/acyl-ACP dehydrogenase [Dehalococcoidia bacterium]